MVTVCGLLGLAVGSFLNVVIHRVPRKESVVRPRSRCPHCAEAIRERDNIPVLSWILLRGRCRACRAPIPARYPFVELATSVLFVGVALRFGADWAVPAFLAFVAGLLALALTDLEHLLLPKRIVHPLILMVGSLLLAAAVAEGRWHRLVVAAVCGAASFAALLAIHLANPRWMAFGDVRLAPVIGMALGWLGGGYVLLGFLVANLLGSLIGLALMAARRISRRSPVPFGVFLALGAYVSVFAGGPILSWYRGL